MQADIPQAASGTRTRQIEAARGRRKEKIWATFDRFGTKSPAFSAFLASSVSLDCKSSGRGRRDNIVRTRSDRKLSEGIKRREKGRSMIQMEFVRRRRLFFVVHVKKTLPAARVQNFDFSPSPLNCFFPCCLSLSLSLSFSLSWPPSLYLSALIAPLESIHSTLCLTKSARGRLVREESRKSQLQMAAPSDAPRVALSTSAGDFVVELYDKEAPQTCDNFMELAKRGYYDGTKVSRGVGGERWRRRRRGRRRERREF